MASSKEQRLAQKFADVVSDRDFDVQLFANHMANESPHAQAVVVRAGLYVADNIADLVKKGCDDPEYQLAIWLQTELGNL